MKWVERSGVLNSKTWWRKRRCCVRGQQSNDTGRVRVQGRSGRQGKLHRVDSAAHSAFEWRVDCDVESRCVVNAAGWTPEDDQVEGQALDRLKAG